MMYLGTLGRMVGIKCPTTQRLGSAPRYSFNTTLGGEVKAQAGPVGRRTWDISTGRLSTPADVGTLMEFATGAWGSGPFWFVPVDAPVVNMLTPDAASCEPSAMEPSAGAILHGSPPMRLGDEGFAARSVWTNGIGTVRFGGPVPVLPDQLITGSAWVVGGGRLRLVFVDSNGHELASEDSSVAEWSTPQRIAVTARAPRTASGVQLAITGPITQAARPAITWTDTAFEWGDGQGCAKAVVRDPNRDLIKAWDTPRTGRWSELSFTVQEVG